MAMTGAHSELLAVEGEIKDILMGFKGTIEEKAGKSFETFEPVKYTKQVVAGMVYHVKINVGGEHIHARVYQPLPHTGQPAECQDLVQGQTADSEMVF